MKNNELDPYISDKPKWELGSDFHYPELEVLEKFSGSDTIETYFKDLILFGSGRAAIRAVLALGEATRGWRKVWLPTYFCAVTSDIFSTSNLEVDYYVDGPLRKRPGLPTGPLSKTDVLFRTNYFGWRGQEAILTPEELGCDIIEDHSHDPIGAWALKSSASYCITSIRKCFPVPDGGCLWSPISLELPEAPSPTLEQTKATEKRVMGMLLKQLYLHGADLLKDEFREIIHTAEEELGKASSIGFAKITETSKAILSILSSKKISQTREENFQCFISACPEVRPYLPVPSLPIGTFPLSIPLVFKSSTRRDSVRKYLIENLVFPAILWPVPDHIKDQEAHDLYSKILLIPCDFRYGPKDMERTAQLFKAAILKS